MIINLMMVESVVEVRVMMMMKMTRKRLLERYVTFTIITRGRVGVCTYMSVSACLCVCMTAFVCLHVCITFCICIDTMGGMDGGLWRIGNRCWNEIF